MAPEAKKILVIDDNRDLVELLRASLGSEGYQTLAAYDGAEGLDRAARERPALIILDIMMPSLNGIEVGKRLKQDPATRNIPVVFLTVLKRRGDEGTPGVGGPNLVLAKPAHVSEVLAAVRQALGEA